MQYFRKDMKDHISVYSIGKQNWFPILHLAVTNNSVYFGEAKNILKLKNISLSDYFDHFEHI